MSEPWGILLTLGVGLAGGLVARVLRLPGGVIMGALIAVAGLHIAVEALSPLPTVFRTAAQIMIGGVIGTTLTRSPVRALASIGGPVSVSIVVLVGGSVALAFAFNAVSGLPLVTALFSTAPGGASDMAAAALKLNADVALIAALHAVRQIVVFVIVVGAFSRLLRRPMVTPSAPHR